MVERTMSKMGSSTLTPEGIGRALCELALYGFDSQLPAQSANGILVVELSVPRRVWLEAGLPSTEAALDGFTDGRTRTYWRTPGADTSVLAVGSVMSVESDVTDGQLWAAIRPDWEAKTRDVSAVLSVSASLAWHADAQEIVLEDEQTKPGQAGDIRWYGGTAFTADVRQGCWEGWPGAWFYVPEFELLQQDHHVLLRAYLHNDPSLRKVVYKTLLAKFTDWFRPGTSEPETNQNAHMTSGIRARDADEALWYQDSVAATAAEIQNGLYHKLVLARRMVSKAATAYRPGLVVRHLQRHYPDSFTFALCRSGQCFLGASPERLVRVTDHVASVDCLAGTTARGDTPAEDAQLAEGLITDPKNRLEHQVVLDWIQAELEGVTESTRYAPAPQIRKLANVQHLHTPIHAQLKEGVTILDLAGRLHPTPAVAGTPRDEVVPLILQREKMDRGWYAGCLGVIDGNGDGELCVSIRSALIQDQTAVLYAGAGIMGDSDPEAEWAETALKLRPMQQALAACRDYSEETSTE